MAESISNRVRLSYVAEVTPGTTPSSALQRVRFTRETFEETKRTKVSDEISEDRQIVDIHRVGVSAAGEVGFELSGTTYDELIAGAMKSAGWSSAVTVTASTISTAANGTSRPGALLIRTAPSAA